MSRLDDKLLPGESILRRAGVSAATVVLPAVAVGVVAVLLLLDRTTVSTIVGVVISLLALYGLAQGIGQVRTNEHLLTDRRLISRTWGFPPRTVEIPLADVEQVIARGGSITVNGRGGVKIRLLFLRDSTAFARAIASALDDGDDPAGSSVNLDR